MINYIGSLVALIFLFLSLFGCGTQEHSKPAPVQTLTQEPPPSAPNTNTGATGPKGDIGAQGTKGDTGATGPKGDKGDSGAKGESTSTNQWFDPITKYWWLIGPNQVYKTDICMAPYAMPTSAQLYTARNHGIFIVFGNSAPSDAWDTDKTGDQVDIVRSDGQLASDTTSGKHGIFCVKTELN